MQIELLSTIVHCLHIRRGTHAIPHRSDADPAHTLSPRQYHFRYHHSRDSDLGLGLSAGIRTQDSVIKNHVLYLLSYGEILAGA